MDVDEGRQADTIRMVIRLRGWRLWLVWGLARWAAGGWWLLAGVRRCAHDRGGQHGLSFVGARQARSIAPMASLSMHLA